MGMIQMICFSILVASAAASVNPIREHPHSIQVTEGMWANFSCGIKLPGNIRWRIGGLNRDGYIYNSAANLPDIEGVTAERSFPDDVTGNVLTETIGILATAEMDGTPVECMFLHPNRSTRDSYSKYALLNVHIHSESGDVIC